MLIIIKKKNEDGHIEHIIIYETLSKINCLPQKIICI